MGRAKSILEVKKDGKVFFRTEGKELFPDARDLKSMKDAGYKVYVDGKIWKTKKKG